MAVVTAASFGQVGTAIANPDIPADPPVEVTGKLTVLHIDDFTNRRGKYRYLLKDKTTKRQFELRFEGARPEGLTTGATVKVRGKAKGQRLTVGRNDGSSLETLTIAPAAPTGVQNTIVMVADFQDLSVSCSVNGVRDLMFTDPSDTSLDDFYQTNSLGQVSFAGDVGGPYPINYSSTGTCDYSAWANAADAAAQKDGFNLSAYNRRIYVMPKNSCSAAGVGTVGGNPSRAWVFDCDDKPLYGHELGHNLVMQHASTLTAEYGDRSDVMGITSGFTHSNAPHKEQMGWLPAAQITGVNRDGIYEIAPLEQDPALALAPQALKIAKPNTSEYYYLSVRRALDKFSVMPLGYLDSVSIHRYKGDGSSSKTYLLDLLQDGESFSDPTNGITITQLNHTSDYATVEVAFGCASAAPMVTLSPSNVFTRGGTASYTASVTNKDSSGCTATTFGLSYTGQPPGTLSSSSLSLAAGATGSTTLQVNTAGLADGSYTLQAQATDSDGVQPYHATAGVGSASVLVDRTPPSVPAGLIGSAPRRNRIQLTWTASTDAGSGVSSYTVYRNGSAIGQTSGTSYTDTTVARGVTYTYTVAALDMAGNGSAPSASATVTARK